MFFDPLYTLVMVVGSIMVFLPQLWVKNTYSKYGEVPNARGLTGAEVAEAILRDNRVTDVAVEPTPGFLSDHYDPTAKRVRLSEENFYGRSVAGVAVAAHECGHAIQHARGYSPVTLRSSLAPIAQFGSGIGPWLVIAALMLGVTGHMMPDWAFMLGLLGIGLFGMAVLFHVVTLPVELDASGRALQILQGGHYLSANEMAGAKKVLNAAALTYVAAALFALMQVLYWLFQLMGARRGD